MVYKKIRWCPFCNQGWVLLVKEISSQTLYCCCDECETEWSSPQDSIENIHYSVGRYGQYEMPTGEEIAQLKWDTYVLEERP